MVVMIRFMVMIVITLMTVLTFMIVGFCIMRNLTRSAWHMKLGDSAAMRCPAEELVKGCVGASRPRESKAHSESSARAIHNRR